MASQKDNSGRGKVAGVYFIAEKKGLTIERMIWGYRVNLPNSSHYDPKSIEDLRDFIKNY